METDASRKHPMLSVLSIRDFRLLFAGTTTSLLGDQFTFIATPWLVLKLTGDPLILGTILALESIPRAVFMLLGGAITDRFSPRKILLIADTIRFILTAMMALIVFTGTVQVWMLYAFGLGFGLVAGFAVPAGNSIVPMLVEKRDLQAGNSIFMGMSQLLGFIGPTVAGILIGTYAESNKGIWLAFTIDALSFAVSAACLWAMRSGRGRQASGEADGAAQESVWGAIWAGVKYLWSDTTLRLMFLVVTVVNFLFVGPLLVGIPVLASQRLPEGAVAYGLLVSGYAGGNLGGYILAGVLPRPTGRGMRIFVIALLTTFGLVMGAIGLLYSTWIDFALMMLLGLGNGYISITMFTWIQKRTPREMLGRMMSMLMLSNNGLVPVSQALSGLVSKWSLTALFVGAGILVLVVTLLTAPQPDLLRFSEDLAT
jgi:MFS family permease